MKRVQLAIGDVFEVPLGDNSKGYFQFIAIDDSQLRSDVIRVFSRRCSQSDEPELNDIVQDRVEFYAHCVINVGIKGDYWRKAGRINISDIEAGKVLFRSTLDFGRSWIDVSNRWEVWRISQPRKFVGELPKSLVSAEYGTVFPPYEIVYRMKYGRYKQDFQR